MHSVPLSRQLPLTHRCDVQSRRAGNLLAATAEASLPSSRQQLPQRQIQRPQRPWSWSLPALPTSSRNHRLHVRSALSSSDSLTAAAVQSSSQKRLNRCTPSTARASTSTTAYGGEVLRHCTPRDVHAQSSFFDSKRSDEAPEQAPSDTKHSDEAAQQSPSERVKPPSRTEVLICVNKTCKKQGSQQVRFKARLNHILFCLP